MSSAHPSVSKGKSTVLSNIPVALCVVFIGGLTSLKSQAIERPTAMATVPQRQEAIAEAFDGGRRAGLAVAAMALGVVTFLSLLGLEKAGLAIILGVLALRGGSAGV